jgi:hypothetical protein
MLADSARAFAAMEYESKGVLPNSDELARAVSADYEIPVGWVIACRKIGPKPETEFEVEVLDENGASLYKWRNPLKSPAQ